ncbi:iron chaperone [Oceanobacillus sp. CAU 1775]
MEIFKEFLNKIEQPAHEERMKEVLEWVAEKYPNLVPEIKWNQPMFTDHGTYIIGFSVAKRHMAVAPENAGIEQFAKDIKEAGHSHTKELVRMKWEEPFNYDLLEKMIEFNIWDKKDHTKFWR